MEEILRQLGTFFSNAWVIGIGGSIVSGIVVAWLSKFIFSEKDNKEYLQKVQSANLEVLYSLRPLITESVFPSTEVLDSLISATAKKYKVEKKSLNSEGQFIDELIKEVMDSSFIPHKKKSEFCTHLIQIKNEATMTSVPESLTLEARLSYRNKMLDVMSLALGLMVGLSVILITIGGKFGEIMVAYPFTPTTATLLLPILIGLVALVLTVLASSLSGNDPDRKDFLNKMGKALRSFLP